MRETIRKNKQHVLPICLILVLSLTRLVSHPWNFTPVLAASIFSGFYFRNFYLSLFIVLLAMFIGDFFLGFHNTMLFTYISLAAAVGIGLFVNKFNFKGIIFSGIISSVLFFLITNFGAWMTLDMYEKNFAGLINSYFLAIPFFHNTLISTLFYLFLIRIVFNWIFFKKGLLGKV